MSTENVLQVLKAIEGFSEQGVKEEAELKPVQTLLNEAYQEIDKVSLLSVGAALSAAQGVRTALREQARLGEMSGM